MDPQQLDPPIELPADLKPQATETINGQPIPLGTVAEFAQAVYGLPLEEIKPWPQRPGGLNLTLEKFVTAWGKFYRLIWRGQGRKWLAAEHVTPYRTRTRVVTAGYELAAKLGAFFDEG